MNISTSYYSSCKYLTKTIVSQSARLLGCQPDDICIYELNDYSKSFRSRSFVYKHDCCYCKIHNLATRYGKNKGLDTLSLWTFKDDPNLKFVETIVHRSFSDFSCREIFLLAPQGAMFRIVRRLLHREKQDLQSKLVPPLLDNNLWDELIFNTLHFVKNKLNYNLLNTKCNRGILLSGEPGNGKTMFCKYLKDMLGIRGISCLSITSLDLIERISKKENPFENRVVFVDDVDVDLFDRKSKGGTACTLLSLMDGFNENISLRIFSTNESISEIDPAFLRPGRIDKCFVFNKPDIELRSKFILRWDSKILSGISASACATLSEGLSFAELDLVKQLLVSKYFADQTWDLDWSIDQVRNRNVAIKSSKNSVGFCAKE